MRYITRGMTIALTVLTARLLLGADGRDFAGFYRTGEVTDLGEHVEVTLAVRVFNYSDADVNGAWIILEDSLLPGQELGSFAQRIEIRDRESARVSEPFVIPRREYEHWQEGAHPQLRLEFTDATGTKQRAPVELAPMLVDPEEQ